MFLELHERQNCADSTCFLCITPGGGRWIQNWQTAEKQEFKEEGGIMRPSARERDAWSEGLQ